MLSFLTFSYDTRLQRCQIGLTVNVGYIGLVRFTFVVLLSTLHGGIVPTQAPGVVCMLLQLYVAGLGTGDTGGYRN